MTFFSFRLYGFSKYSRGSVIMQNVKMISEATYWSLISSSAVSPLEGAKRVFLERWISVFVPLSCFYLEFYLSALIFLN